MKEKPTRWRAGVDRIHEAPERVVACMQRDNPFDQMLHAPAEPVQLVAADIDDESTSPVS